MSHSELPPGHNEQVITPHEALAKLTYGHSAHFVEKMRQAEYEQFGRIVSAFEAGADGLLADTEYNPNAIPQLKNWNLPGFVNVKEGEDIYSRTDIPEGVQPFMVENHVAPSEFPKIEYNFGQQVLDTQECVALVGESFAVEAAAAVARVDERYKRGTIKKELVQGVTLKVEVVDENNAFGETPGQEPDYRIVASYAAVPLDSSAAVTGKTLVDAAMLDYKKDFNDRYTAVLSGSTEDLYTYEDTTVEEMAESILRYWQIKGTEDIAADNKLEVLTDPKYLSTELRLYLLAKMQIDLQKAGTTVPPIVGTDIEEHLGIVLPAYLQMIHEQTSEDDLQRMMIQHKVENRKPTASLSEQEKAEIIGHNLAVLRHLLVDETSRSQLDELSQRTANGIVVGEGHIIEEGMIEQALTIFYKTGSGQIMRAPKNEEILPGDYSKLHTSYINKDRQVKRKVSLLSRAVRYAVTNTAGTTIQIAAEEGALSFSEIIAAVTGDDTLAHSENLILPERIHPLQKDYAKASSMGRPTHWGSAHWNEPAEGDFVLLRTLQLFNEKFGPQK